MYFDEALEFVRKSKPVVLYLGGKTSTGKSTFARILEKELDYKVVELDRVVAETVIKANGQTDRGQVFSEVYKQRHRLDWISKFVAGAKAEVERIRSQHHRVILEGAIAHPETLKEVLSSFSDATFLYFHPEHLDIYERNLTSRFMEATETFNAGLPIEFWKLVDKLEFSRFCETRNLTDGLRQAIHAYALHSRDNSEMRLKAQADVVRQIVVVRV